LRAPPPAEAVGIDPRGLHLAFRALATSPEPSRNPRKGGHQSGRVLTSFLLSWPCPLVAPPSCHSSASTPGHRCKQRWPSGQGSTPDSCSARVVSHHLDGLLRTEACGFVAPRFRPWGSPRFVPAVPRLRRDVGDPRGLPRSAVIPFKGFPSFSSRTASLRPLPPCLLPRARTPPTCRKGVPPHPKAPRWAEVDVGGALVHRGEPPHRGRSLDGGV
jgi:hypothetical protein